MANVTVAPQNIVPAGLTVIHTGSLSTSNNYKIRNDGRMFIRIVNGSGGSVVVTIVTQKQVGGNAVVDRAVTVLTVTEQNIGPFPPSIYNDSNGDIDVSFDVITSVTIAALHL